MVCRRGLVLLALFLFSSISSADELLMKNGSRLVGTLVSASQSELVFDTPFAGEITITQGNIDVIVTDQNVTLMMEDGSIYRDKQIVSRDEELLITSDNQLPLTVDVVDIQLINPEPWMLGDGYKWFGQLNAALASERGNTDTDELDIDFESIWRSLEDRYTLRGNWEIDRTDGLKNKDKWKLQGKYDWFSQQDPDNYYGGQIQFEKDVFADLDLRSKVGPYIGRQFFESEPLTVHGELGIVYVDEQFKVARDDRYWGSSWEFRVSSGIIPDMELYIHNDGILNFEDPSAMVINTIVGIGLPVIYGITAALEAKFEYDGGAVEGVDNMDETYKFKLGYGW